ncbi:MAG: sugar ABC transporter ATP-binding protein [Spirochaetaceae bacterium]
MADYFLETRNVSKAYAGVQALEDVSLNIGRGEIHCLVGENGSGKSTMIKIIGGVVQPDTGEIVYNGTTYKHVRAIDAICEGVQIIYQDLSLFPNLTVAENISLNQMVERGAKMLDWGTMRGIAREALQELGESIDLNEIVENLSMAKKQVVAISRALTQNAKLIIMDEPTSALTREEVEHLFSVIHTLKDKGIATLFVSHKLNEVFEIAENVTVLRDGKKVGDFGASELDGDRLTYLMTGQTLEYEYYTYRPEAAETPVLELRNLTRTNEYRDISFRLQRGEILGITGLIGSGRTELALSLFGMTRAEKGEILVDGRPARIFSPQDAFRYGIAYLPEDRLARGIFGYQSVGDNIVVTILKRLLDALGLIDGQKKDDYEKDWIKSLAIRTPSQETPASSLSGGNQQRVVLAKWLATDPKVFILDGPTIGIDIASKGNIHRIIRDLAEQGMAFIMISDEIEEVLRNCNRVLIMKKGRIAGEITNPAEAKEEDVFEMVRSEINDEVATA